MTYPLQQRSRYLPSWLCLVVKLTAQVGWYDGWIVMGSYQMYAAISHSQHGSEQK
jgi:hypothetical protein